MCSLLSRLYGPTVVETTLPGTPAEVWEVLSDPNTYPEWLVGADHMRSVDSAFPRPGSGFDHTVGLGQPLTVDDRTDSLEADALHHLALLVRAGPFHARVDFHLRARPDGDTDLRFEEVPVGWFGPLTPVLRPTLKARNLASVERLREVLRKRAAAT